jgi:hypothetical protein
MSIKIHQHLPLQGPPKFTQITIFGLTIWQPCSAAIFILKFDLMDGGRIFTAFQTSLSLFFCVSSPGANPTTVSYNASVVKIYNATSSLVRFENKNIFFYFEKTLLPTTTLALYLVVNFDVVGLVPGFAIL